MNGAQVLSWIVSVALLGAGTWLMLQFFGIVGAVLLFVFLGGWMAFVIWYKSRGEQSSTAARKSKGARED